MHKHLVLLLAFTLSLAAQATPETAKVCWIVRHHPEIAEQCGKPLSINEAQVRVIMENRAYPALFHYVKSAELRLSLNTQSQILAHSFHNPSRLLGPRALTAWADSHFELISYDWENNAYLIINPLPISQVVKLCSGMVGDGWVTINDMTKNPKAAIREYNAKGEVTYELPWGEEYPYKNLYTSKPK